MGKQARQLALLLDPLAAMMVKKIHPVKDELSMNAAYKEYGRAWIEEQRFKGNLTARAKGNRLVLSRAEIETLRAVYEQTPKVIIKNSTRNARTRK